IDVERFLSALRCAEVPTVRQESKPELVLDPKGIGPLETILLARYLLFSEVYWHKACRSTIAMIKQAFWMVFKKGAITQEAMEEIVLNMNDLQFLKWLYEKLVSLGAPKFEQAAQDLVFYPFLTGSRKFYKRLVTYSAIRDGETHRKLIA